MNPSRLIRILFFFYTEIIFIIYFVILLFFNIVFDDFVKYCIAGLIGMIILRTLGYVYTRRFFLPDRIDSIKELLSDYKKGKFKVPKKSLKGKDDLSIIYRELITVGKHIGSIVNSQRNEIDQFQELYNSIVFSISTYYVILSEIDEIVYANEGFCSKFHFTQDEVIGKKIEELFYFVHTRLKEGIAQVKNYGKTLVLEKTHLLSVKKVSIIADIKISTIMVAEKKHEIIVIDDVTNKLQKDYQISLMSQISEFIQRDDEIERILHTILTGVTSGSDLGFNRAMLFLLDNRRKNIIGKMAVGPDSFEEAIEIWGSVSSTGNILEEIVFIERRSGKELLKNVLSRRYSMDEDNIFIRAIKSKKYIHIKDVWIDTTISNEIKEFLDVNEVVIVPLIAVNRSIGIIIVDNKFNQAPIEKDNIELLSIFASQAALSIESYVSLESVKSEMGKISERQDAIVESEKLAAIGRISAHIAHEIRNPLVTMGGFARRIYQMVKDKDKGKDASGIKDAAQIILNESERLEKILSNVMDFTRPTRQIREFNNINDVIVDTVNLLKNLFLENKIEILLNLNNEIPLVKCDFNQMKQVMLNLLQNAIDVTPEGGTVGVVTDNDNLFISLSVKDTGNGIDQDDPNVIFEPFFTTKVTGVGLGLAIVKRIIKDHKGNIEVQNRKSGGTKFIINLPVP